MWTELHWVEGPWPGKLAVSARPRGEDWLQDEIKGWRKAGIDIVLSLLEPAEERDLGLKNEAREATSQQIQFFSFPIPDRQVPKSEPQLRETLE